MGGRLYVVSRRLHGKVFISINAYLIGRINTQDALREDALRTLAEFDLTAEIHG
jgi:hypothetical protein